MFSKILCLFCLFLRAAAFYPKGRGSMSMSFNLDKVVNTLSINKILTKTSELGLLSRLERAGFTLKSAAPILVLADKYDALGVLEASSDKVLPLVAQAIELAPAALPLVSVLIKTPPSTLFGGAIASIAAAGAVVSAIPDDSVVDIALQTALAVPFGAIVPGALGVAGLLLSKLK